MQGQPRIPGAVTPLPQDDVLFSRIREGDRAAFESVFRQHYAMLVGFVGRYVRSEAAGEEIVQDLFLKLWLGRDLLPPVDSPKAYLYRAARNAALNHMRRERLERQWAERSAREDPAFAEPAMGAGDEEALAAAARAAIDALPKRCRLIFTMSRDDGLTYTEIAQALGLSVKTVETQMGRALKALRAALAPHL